MSAAIHYSGTIKALRKVSLNFFEKKTSEWWSRFIVCPDHYPHVISEMFHHFLDMKEEIDLLYHAGLSYLLMNHIIQCGKQSHKGEMRDTYQTVFVSGELCGLVNEWILRGMKDEPEKMEQIFISKSDTGEINS